MDMFIYNKMTSLFDFPETEKENLENLVTYSYIGLLTMSSFITSDGIGNNDDSTVDYYSIHRELAKIARQFIKPEWCEREEKLPKDDKEKKKIISQTFLDIEKNLEKFGHINNFSLESNSNLKKYVTNNEIVRYKNVCFKLGMPSDMINRKISGFTVLESFSDKIEEKSFEYGFDIDILISTLKEDFLEMGTSDFKILDLFNSNDKYMDNWIPYDGKEIEFNVARKLEFDHWVYFLYQKKKNVLVGKRIEDKSVVKNEDLHKRIVLYLKNKYHTPLKAEISDNDDNFIKLSLPISLPKYENTILYNIGFPCSGYYNKLNFYIRKELEEFVTDLLRNAYFLVVRK